MIHRAPFGSLERFVAVLIEHFAGAFPLWLSPVQVAVLPISEKVIEYAGQVEAALKEAGLRVELNTSAEKIGAKIRQAALDKVPYMVVVGQQEAEAKKVAVRTRGGVDQGQMALEEFVERCREEVAAKGQAQRSWPQLPHNRPE
jgi:threonyl-tRNA synthetase